MNYLYLATLQLYGNGDWYYDGDQLVNNTSKHFDIEKISNLSNELSSRDRLLSSVSSLNLERNNLLNNLILDNVLCSEDQLRSMFVAYSLASDGEKIKWIDVNNNFVEFSKDDFYSLIKRAKDEIASIYFKYRVLKDQLNGIS